MIRFELFPFPSNTSGRILANEIYPYDLYIIYYFLRALNRLLN